MNDKGVTQISEKFLSTGDLFGIKFNEGYVFCEVTGWEQIKFAPHSAIGSVGSDSASGFDRLKHDGDDILFTEKRKKKVKHAAIGHSPSVIRRYTNYPEGETRLRKLENIGTPSAGDDFGYVDGESSPYYSPTDAEELYIPPGNHLDFNFYNPDNEDHNVVMNILLREYDVRPLKKGRDNNAINRIISPGSPMPIAPAGSADRQVAYDLSEFWGVDVIPNEKVHKRGGN